MDALNNVHALVRKAAAVMPIYSQTVARQLFSSNMYVTTVQIKYLKLHGKMPLICARLFKVKLARRAPA
jgi:hypothetical protein